MSGSHSVKVRPVFAFTAKHVASAGFYTDVIGLEPGTGGDPRSPWLKPENSDVVFHAPEDRETPHGVRGQTGFVVGCGVDAGRGAFDTARAAKAVVGAVQGDDFSS